MRRTAVRLVVLECGHALGALSATIPTVLMRGDDMVDGSREAVRRTRVTALLLGGD